MKFYEKLQNLRKQHHLTQEELAKKLYVSRTAVSKWESGRGFPNIDSLKAIATCFGVSVDELLSSEEVLALAQEDRKQQKMHLRDLLFGLLDCAAALLFFLPFFAEKSNETIHSVSLLALTDVQSYLKTVFLAFVATTVLLGILTLALQNCRKTTWLRGKYWVSLLLGVVGVCLFIVCRQPYAAVFLFAFLMIKAVSLINRQ